MTNVSDYQSHCQLHASRQIKREVPSIIDTSTQVKTTRAVKFVFGNSVSVSDQSGTLVLELDEFDELIGSYASLVTKSEALREEFDEAEFERVTDEPDSYQRTPLLSSDYTHLKDMARSTLLPKSMTFLPMAGTRA